MNSAASALKKGFEPEMRYTLELARVLSKTIDEVSAAQERVGRELAFDRSLLRGREAIIAMLTKATRELVPLDGEEMGRFLRSLEYGEIPEGEFFNQESRKTGTSEDLQISNRAGSIESMRLSTAKESSVKVRARAPKFLQKKGRSVFGTRAREPIANGKSSPDAKRHSVPFVPSDEKSEEVMSQWR